jgi:hypothetical protein
MAQKRRWPTTIATLRPQDHFTNAATMCREMGMRFRLEQAEAEIGTGRSQVSKPKIG